MTDLMENRRALTTGWEPDLPTSDSLLRRFVFAMADRLTEMAKRADARAACDADACYVDLASPFHYDNAVVLLRPLPPDGLADVLARARTFFPAGRAWIALSAWPTPDLSTFGLTLVGHPPLMVRLPAPLPAPPRELEVRAVRTTGELADFERTLIEGFPFPEGADVFDPHQLDDLLRLFVGYVDGRPVAVAGAAVGHGVVEVSWVATLPDARGRGYGAALTAAAIGVAPQLPAVLIASDPGRPIYHRLGFFDLLRLTLWEAGVGG